VSARRTGFATFSVYQGKNKSLQTHCDGTADFRLGRPSSGRLDADIAGNARSVAAGPNAPEVPSEEMWKPSAFLPPKLSGRVCRWPFTAIPDFLSMKPVDLAQILQAAPFS
jgi:hypothetical protein